MKAWWHSKLDGRRARAAALALTLLHIAAASLCTIPSAGGASVANAGSFDELGSVFVLGFHNSGTNWLHCLLMRNGASEVAPGARDDGVRLGVLPVLKSMHEFRDEDGRVARQPKHGMVQQSLLDSRVITVLIVRRYEHWWESMQNKPWENTITPDGLLQPAYGWSHGAPENPLSVLARVTMTNVARLRASNASYVVALHDQMVRGQEPGVELLRILRAVGVPLRHNLVPNTFDRHAKTGSRNWDPITVDSTQIYHRHARRHLEGEGVEAPTSRSGFLNDTDAFLHLLERLDTGPEVRVLGSVRTVRNAASSRAERATNKHKIPGPCMPTPEAR